MKIVEYIGVRFGRLVATHRLPSITQPSGQKRAMYLCRCDCGRDIEVRAADLRGGNTTSCGHHRVAHNRSHGRSRSRGAYVVWLGMRRRCTRQVAPEYARYGGRGIQVCSRWEQFENFLADMGEPPPGMQLDRIDNDGPYAPENCRWTTPAVQSRNRRSNISITINGETKCLLDWTTHYGLVGYATARIRIRNGWDPLRAITERPQFQRLAAQSLTQDSSGCRPPQPT